MNFPNHAFAIKITKVAEPNPLPLHNYLPTENPLT